MMNDVGGGEGEEVGEHSTDIWVLDLRGIAAGQHMGSVGHTTEMVPNPRCYTVICCFRFFNYQSLGPCIYAGFDFVVPLLQ